MCIWQACAGCPACPATTLPAPPAPPARPAQPAPPQRCLPMRSLLPVPGAIGHQGKPAHQSCHAEQGCHAADVLRVGDNIKGEAIHPGNGVAQLEAVVDPGVPDCVEDPQVEPLQRGVRRRESIGRQTRRATVGRAETVGGGPGGWAEQPRALLPCRTAAPQQAPMLRPLGWQLNYPSRGKGSPGQSPPGPAPPASPAAAPPPRPRRRASAAGTSRRPIGTGRLQHPDRHRSSDQRNRGGRSFPLRHHGHG